MQFEADEFATRRTFEMNDVGAKTKSNDEPGPDWKRRVLIVGLGALSWVATYVGMLELIQANMGDLPLIHKVIIGFSVAMLMTMIIWLLDQLFRPHAFLTKLFYAGGYAFLTLISVGFGFGFYWKVLESRSEASRSAESAVTQVQTSLHAASTRLEQLNATLLQLSTISSEKAVLERTKGTSCPNSRPGDGPRRKMRDDDAQRFTFASEFVNGRIGAVKTDLAALNGDLAKVVSSDPATFSAATGTRNEFMRALSRKLDMTVTGFNAFRTDPQLKQIRGDLAARADRTTFDNGRGGTISCPDPQLQTALYGVVKAIDQLPVLEKPEIAAVEGSEATIEAFRRLTTTFYGLLAFKLPPSADELRELQKKAVQSVEGGPSASAFSTEQGGLSRRDYVPLAVALFVDLCLLLVSMVQRGTNRLDGLMPKMQAAERGPIIQILSRFNDIHKDQAIRENFEIFRHVVFDMNGDYYVAVPLDAPPRLNPKEREDLRVEAQLLANLFASFEKDKIFKRTMLPTTASVQKRLKRQGSKFAGSEAFRVYKFTDGAWSDIILGAVMGAARRVEMQERATRPMRTINTATHELPDAPTQTIAPPEHQPATAADRPKRPTLRPVTEPPRTVPTPVRRSYTAALLSEEREQPAPTAPPAAPRAREQSLSLDPEHVSRFGPYANIYRPEPYREPPAFATAPQGPRVAWPEPAPPPEADVTVRAQSEPDRPDADNDTSTAAAIRHNETPEADADGATSGTIDVTLRRETATFSVPVSEAQLPGSLKAALKKAAAKPETTIIKEEQKVLAPPPLPKGAVNAETSDPSELSDEDIAFIGRIAPEAAE